MWVPKITLLIGLVAVGLVQATSPTAQGVTSNIPKDDGFKWDITSYKVSGGTAPSNDAYISYQTIPSDVYHHQLTNSNNLNDVAYTFFSPNYHVSKAKELKEAHESGLLSDVAYEVLTHNEKEKMFAHSLVKKGGAIRIGSMIHHPAGTPGQSLIPDIHGDKIPFMVFTPTKTIKTPHNDHVLQKMTIAHPSRAASSSSGSLPSNPITSSARQMLQHVLPAPSSVGQSSGSLSNRADKGKSPETASMPPKETSWHVTTPKRTNEGGHSRIETISQYIQRHLQKGTLDEIDLPENYELDNGPMMTSGELQKYKRQGYSDKGIQDLIHNKEQKRLAYNFIKKGGIVKFPDAAHHPISTPPEQALSGGNDPFSLAHIYYEPLNEQGRPNRLLHLYRWLPTSELKPGSIGNLPHQRSQRKRPREPSSHDTPTSSDRSQRTV